MNLTSIIEHTHLAPDASEPAIERLCAEAVQYEFRAVCVNPLHVARCAQLLRDKGPFVVSVAGFPTGASCTQTKVYEAARAVEHGASEIDMVMRIGALKEGRADEVEADIAAVVRATSGRPVKVIIETGLLLESEIALACRVLENAGAAFGKTSTGFFGTGATVDVVSIMRKSLGKDVRIKASGGIKTRAQAQKLVDAGAERIGCSASISIIGENDE